MERGRQAAKLQSASILCLKLAYCFCPRISFPVSVKKSKSA